MQLQQLFCKVEDTSEGKIKENLTLTGGAAEPNSAEAYLQASCFAGKRIPYLFKPLLTLVLVVPSIFPKDTVLKSSSFGRRNRPKPLPSLFRTTVASVSP